MCGFAGLLDSSLTGAATAAAVQATRMCDRIRYRGPDDAGCWSDASVGFAVAHRRLSILDLSPAGSQPMHSSDGRFVLAFNGEIYNHPEMREDVERARGGVAWRGHSDTEVLLEAIGTWGLAGSLRRAVGMYALALWDRRDRKLSLARDRAGEKPLYYGWAGARLLFASELKAFAAHSEWRPRLEPVALAAYLRYGYVPSPLSIYSGTYKLPAAAIAEVSAAESHRLAGAALPPEAYWSLSAHAASGRTSMQADEAVDELERLLRRSVAGQMAADVPVGAFLSGGIDSSTVVALMQAQSGQRVRTFSIGFPDRAYNEADQASAVAAHLGTDHTELYIEPRDAQAAVARMATVYDEPFADVSAVPTHLVSILARKSVTVSLSGDAGDELFGGYNRYVWPRRITTWRSLLPGAAWRAVAAGLGSVPSAFWRFSESVLARGVPARWRYGSIPDKVAKLADVLRLSSPEEIYLRLVSLNPRPSELLQQGYGDEHIDVRRRFDIAGARTAEERMMYADFMTYLPDDILVKLDRASMAVGLESRAPFLDHRIVEFAWRLPLDLVLREGTGKWILRQVLYRYVPPALVKRPKMGFGMPIDSWLRGPLREWAEDLLGETALSAHGLFDTRRVRALWADHLEGTASRQYQLWTILMFQGWFRRSQSPES